LPAQEIADDGLTIGLGRIRLDLGQHGFIVVQDQVDGDVVGGLGHETGHGARSQTRTRLNSCPLEPFRGNLATPPAGGKPSF
jgi:hypothetical protein